MSTPSRHTGGPGEGTGPTVSRMQLGSRLRALRIAADVTREAAGYSIRASESKISRMELGRVGFKERDVTDLLTLYGVAEPDQAELLALAREANRPGWWQAYSDVLPAWFLNYLDLEQAAELIRSYEIQFVPGLLQTEAYARAVISIGHGRSTKREIDRRVELRMARQTMLTRPGGPRLWAVLDEAVLLRPMGNRAIHREQLEALLKLTEAPAVRLQVVPFSAGGHAAAGGAFSILRFALEEVPDVVFLEQLTGSLYLDRPEDVDEYAAAAGRLFIDATTPERTADVIHRALREL
ncbi:helix-turn-helix transcriptional regulator [Catenuloplanes indicus JCM 9534]|uniref:Transcriptional regulator with XRE-family HTH domain n=2 Tax=Catenuloplanes indicus TaxID=137267 RepID=A0AAE3VYS6_9ACTN|nr:transcriptional regulator with XRE-family HTH domain [Catenuloplanes indicus]